MTVKRNKNGRINLPFLRRVLRDNQPNVRIVREAGTWHVQRLASGAWHSTAQPYWMSERQILETLIYGEFEQLPYLRIA